MTELFIKILFTMFEHIQIIVLRCDSLILDQNYHLTLNAAQVNFYGAVIYPFCTTKI